MTTSPRSRAATRRAPRAIRTTWSGARLRSSTGPRPENVRCVCWARASPTSRRRGEARMLRTPMAPSCGWNPRHHPGTMRATERTGQPLGPTIPREAASKHRSHPATNGVTCMRLRVRSALVSALMLVTGSVPGVGAPAPAPTLAWPTTLAASRLQALVEAYNTGDSVRVVAFVRRSYPPAITSRPGAPERVAAYWRSVWREFGPAKPFAMLPGTPRSAEVWMRGDITQAWFTLQVEVSEDTLHSVIGSGVGRGISPPLAVAPRALPAGQLSAEIAAYLERLDRTGFFSGAVLVARADRIVFRGCAGYANREHGVRNRPDTRFDIASVAKMLTAASVLRLVADGQLSLDDSIGRFLPDYPRPLASRITMRHLLTHSSGIELDDDSLYNHQAETARSLAAIVSAQVRGLARHPDLVEIAPGQRFDYTNEGFDLAGAIVENVCGRPFGQCLDSLVLTPAGMRNTGLFASDQAIPGLATGYTSADGVRSGMIPGPLRTNHLWLSAYGRPSGQLYSTVDDLWRFARALRGHALLRAPFDSAMTAAPILVNETPETREEY